MLERLAGTVLDRILSKYFEKSNEKASVGIWSGYLSLHNLRLQTDKINLELRAKGLPLQLLHGSIKHVEITVPWSQWGSSLLLQGSAAATAVVVIDGLSVVVDTNFYEFDNDAIRRAGIEKRRKALIEQEQASVAEDKDERWLVRAIKQSLAEGVLPSLLDRFELHIRDVHIRLEDTKVGGDPCAVGLAWESLHIQHETSPAKSIPDCLSKVVHLNQFAVYWDPLRPQENDEDIALENRIVSALKDEQSILQYMDRTIPRRASVRDGSSPLHAYVLHPVDLEASLYVSRTSSNLLERPALEILCALSPQVSIRDFQLRQGILWHHHFKDHIYLSRRPYRKFRPSVPVKEDPVAWWRYAYLAVHRYSLTRKSLSMSLVRESLQNSKVYCSLYERLLLNEEEHSLDLYDQQQLRDLEDGMRGDLTVADILLFRIMSRKRLGVVSTPLNKKAKRPWLTGAIQTLVADDKQASEEFERVLEQWNALTSNKSGDGPLNDDAALYSALKFTIVVQSGRATVFVPLSATSDYKPWIRIQERCLEVSYEAFKLSGSLLGDYETIRLESSLADCRVSQVSQQGVLREIVFLHNSSSQQTGVFALELVKPRTNKRPTILKVRVNTLSIQLHPTGDLIPRLLLFLSTSIPKIDGIDKLWRELNLAAINSWASERLGIVAKLNTAVKNHQRFDLDISIQCPILEVHASDSIVRVALGSLSVNTKKLSVGARESTRLDTYSMTAIQQDTQFGTFQSTDETTLWGETSRFGWSDGDTDVAMSDERAEFLFYDAYDVAFHLGAIEIGHIGDSSLFTLSDGAEASAVLFKSILPADRTLFRYRVVTRIPKLHLRISHTKLILLSKVLRECADAIRGLDSSAFARSDVIHSIRSTAQTDSRIEMDMDTFNNSVIDSDEFFDTLEDDGASKLSLNESEDESWGFQSIQSMPFESELSSRRFMTPRARATKKRMKSNMSDVSSLSDGSSSRLRVHNSYYLSAENLAKLDEEAFDVSVHSSAADEMVGADIFRSDVQTLIKSIDDRLSKSKDTWQNSRHSSELSTEALRKSAELVGLSLIHGELSDVLERVERDLLDPSSVRAQECLRRAVALLHGEEAAAADGDESEQKLLRVCVAVETFSVDIESELPVLSSKLMLRDASVICSHFKSKQKFRFCVGGAVVASTESHSSIEDLVLVGGQSCAEVQGLLPSLLPRVLTSNEQESLLTGSFEASRMEETSQEISIRLTVGDIELRPTQELIEALCHMQALRKASTSKKSNTKSWKQHVLVDASVRMMSTRILYPITDDTFCAVILTDAGAKVKGNLSGVTYSERTNSDLRLGNIQLVALEDPLQDEWTEVYNKRASGLPLFRIRCRSQLVAVDDDGGWVVNTTPKTTKSSSQKAQNCYVMVTAQPANVVFIPSWVTSVASGLRALQKTWKKKSAVGDVLSANETLATPVRWKFEAALNDISFRVQTSLHFELSRSKSTMTSLQVSLTLQRSSVLRQGWCLHLKIVELSLTSSPSAFQVLKPFSCQVTANIPSQHTLCAPLFPPQLEGEFERPSTGDAAHIEDVIGIDVLCDPIEINLSAGIMKNLSSIFKDVGGSLKSPPDVSQEARRVALPLAGLSLTLNSVQLRLFRSSPAALEPVEVQDKFLISTTLENVSGSLDSNANAISICLSVTNILLLDASFLSGSHIIEKKNTVAETILDLSFVIGRTEEESYSLETTLILASIQLLLLPSFVRSILIVKEEYSDRTQARPSVHLEEKTHSSVSRLFERVKEATVSFVSDRLDLVLLSRDISRQSRCRSQDPFGCIVVRTQLHFGLRVIQADASECTSTDLWGLSLDAIPTDRLDEYLSSLDQNVPHRVVFWKLDADLTELKIIRSCASMSVAAPRRIRQIPPALGEQRITNSCTLSAKHRMVLSTQDSNSPMRLSQSISLTTDFVDVLVYISQSGGGISEVLQHTIVPISTMLAARRGNKHVEDCSAQSEPHHGIKDALFLGPSSVYFSVDGLQATLVPGGATKLTESPIVKLSIKRITGGGSVVAVSRHSTHLRTHGPPFYKTYSAFWGTLELSAYYHNRRLVIWEPVIEPWTVRARGEVDINDMFQLIPVDATNVATESETTSTPLVPKIDTRETLRDIGRFLASPFKSGAESGVDFTLPRIFCEGDFCYKLLTWFARAEIERATVDGKYSTERMLPHLDVERWLPLYGAQPDPAMGRHRMDLHVSDVNRLNINFSGALVENLWHLVDGSLDDSNTRTPHRIINQTGLALRYREVLEVDRVAHGEEASTVCLNNMTEAPLILKRTLSQSCDPHRARITVELGSFEDTVGRITHDKETDKAMPYSDFAYRISTDVSVDTVGLEEYQLVTNDFRRNVTKTPFKVLVNVTLDGGTKVVTIQSPLCLRNNSALDFLLELRDEDRIASVWRTIAPCTIEKDTAQQITPLPVDLIADVESSSALYIIGLEPGYFRDESDVNFVDSRHLSKVEVPGRYSRVSFKTGFVKESTITANIFGQPEVAEPLFLNLCLLRLGTFAVDSGSGGKGVSTVPQQRLVVLRPPYTFRNFLSFAIRISVRCKGTATKATDEWQTLGVVECGRDCSWHGNLPKESFELKIRACSSDGLESVLFPSWSSSISISHRGSNGTNMRLLDNNGSPLVVSLNTSDRDPLSMLENRPNDMFTFAQGMQPASRVISLYAPYWIVDSTGIDLEYKSPDAIAGQDEIEFYPSEIPERSLATQGLAELVDDMTLPHTPSNGIVRVIMIGNPRCSHLCFRRRLRMEKKLRSNSPWSNPLSLQVAEDTAQDAYVTTNGAWSAGSIADTSLSWRVVRAPSSLGGCVGTRLIHLVCKYEVSNFSAWDLEISNCFPSWLPADGKYRSIHFDAAKPLRIRPTEQGWNWSGRLDIRKRRKEVTLNLKHALKNLSVMVTVSFRLDGATGGCLMMISTTKRPPYRVKNKAMAPIQFRQARSLIRYGPFGDTTSSEWKVVLPFHEICFAWDEPDFGLRTIVVQEAKIDTTKSSSVLLPILGSYKLDSLPLGSSFEMENPAWTCSILSDGPCKIFSVASLVEHESARELEPSNGSEEALVRFDAKLTCGVGVSVIDWQPRELVYVSFEDCHCKIRSSSSQRISTLSIMNVMIDNQLWITPYPVALRIGSRSSNRRHGNQGAVSIRLAQAFNKHKDVFRFHSVEIATDPLMVSIDGTLADSALGMLRKVGRIWQRGSDSTAMESRNAILRRELHIRIPYDDKVDLEQRKFLDLYRSIDSVASSAFASKLQTHYIPPNEVAKEAPTAGYDNNVMKMTRQYYIERLRLSSAQAKVSWSGSLPIAASLPRLLRPALTFEALPLFVRPFSRHHFYGSTDDCVEEMKSHYFNVWRLLDIFVGIAVRPLFLLRAFVFTWRESAASVFTATGHLLGRGQELQFRTESWLINALTTPLLSCSKSVLAGMSSLALKSAKLLHYDPAHLRSRAGLVRARNPRLFAYINGRDVLVDYVEGENAGRALLSRVRRGAHLSEGFRFMVEDVHDCQRRRHDHFVRTPASLLLMVTFERLLLLCSEMNDKFCDVEWELPCNKLVDVDELGSDGQYTLIALWFLDVQPISNKTRAMAPTEGVDEGLECLHCKHIFIPGNFKQISSLVESKL